MDKTFIKKFVCSEFFVLLLIKPINWGLQKLVLAWMF